MVIPFSAIYALTWQRTSCNPHTGHRGQASAPPANSGPSPSLPPPLNCIAAGNHEPNALALPQAPTVVPGSCHCVGRVQRPGAGGHASTAHALPSSAIMSIMTRCNRMLQFKKMKFALMIAGARMFTVGACPRRRVCRSIGRWLHFSVLLFLVGAPAANALAGGLRCTPSSIAPKGLELPLHPRACRQRMLGRARAPSANLVMRTRCGWLLCLCVRAGPACRCTQHHACTLHSI